MPLVSVVVPTHNRARLLKRTLRSILDQRVSDLEVIVVDDGSADETASLAAGADTRVRVLRNAVPSGVSAARNRGIAAARGGWVAFCDDDDLWSPDKLARQLLAAEHYRTNWAYAGDVNVDDGLHVLSGGPPPDAEAVLALLPRWNPLSSGGSNVIVRTETLTAVGGFDPGLRRTEDWDLWIRLARTGPPACACEPLVAYRFHGGNVAAAPWEMVDEARQLAARHAIPIDMSAMYRRAAWAALRGGRRLEAVQHYAQAAARGDLRSVVRAAVALFHPAVGSNRLFEFLARDDDWVGRAKAWLEPFAAHLSPDERGEAV
jgi:glycosyltransferase involved in cell wall biosynthesis